ncbi:MAG: hypothetical protein SchgKO_24930 [Schleiferiaceae bacterium]
MSSVGFCDQDKSVPQAFCVSLREGDSPQVIPLHQSRPLKKHGAIENRFAEKSSMDQKKKDLVEWIGRVEDSALIDYLHSISKSDTIHSNWWKDLSIDELNSIKKGIEDSVKGKTHSHESVVRKFTKS